MRVYTGRGESYGTAVFDARFRLKPSLKQSVFVLRPLIMKTRERLCPCDVNCLHDRSRRKDFPSGHRPFQQSASSGEPGHDGVQHRRIIRLSGNVLVSSFVRDTLKYRMGSVRRRLTRSRPYFVPQPITVPPSASSLAVLRPLLLWNVDFGDLTRILVAASFA